MLGRVFLCQIVFATHSVYLKPTMCACAPEGERSKTQNVTFFVFTPGDPPCENAKMKDTITTLKTWHVFAWRPFAPPCENTTDERRKLATYKCRIFAWRDERSPRENPPHGDFFVFSRSDLSPRQAKIRQTGGEKAKHEKCRTFVWRGERSPCENTKKWPFGGFSRGAFSPFRPENTIIRNSTNKPPYENPLNGIIFYQFDCLIIKYFCDGSVWSLTNVCFSKWLQIRHLCKSKPVRHL